jgi:hypothetical protein
MGGQAMNQHENVPQYPPGQVVLTGNAHITTAATIELRRLFDLVADLSDAAGEILKGAERPPGDSDLDRLRVVTARIEAMVARLRAILD